MTIRDVGIALMSGLAGRVKTATRLCVGMVTATARNGMPGNTHRNEDGDRVVPKRRKHLSTLCFPDVRNGW